MNDLLQNNNNKQDEILVRKLKEKDERIKHQNEYVKDSISSNELDSIKAKY